MFKSFLRRLRGVIGTGLTWAVVWSVAGTALQAGLALFGVLRAPDLTVTPLMWGLMGLYGGILFGGLVSLTEGRETLRDLRVGRVAGWGAIAGFAVPVVYNLLRGDSSAISMVSLLTNAVIFAPLSAGSAAGMIRLAQRAERAQLGTGDETMPVEGEDPMELPA